MEIGHQDRCRRALAREQAESLAGTDGWAQADSTQVHRDRNVLHREIAARLEGCSLPGDQEVQELVSRHLALVSRFFAPPREACVGMSLLYAEDEAMRAFHDAHHAGMVAFVGAAIEAFAQQGSGFAPSAEAGTPA
ncbi:TipAS antibiotic-recognition domain-containing protein [Kitasatospora sp. NPDC096147]|uniref:TipAS antibiotic-recognition domain-containing protein n=1 Tax=Kitasatospora sp. NPDC096147 TaxID=3364093 RepID=UPI0037FB526C